MSQPTRRAHSRRSSPIACTSATLRRYAPRSAPREMTPATTKPCCARSSLIAAMPSGVRVGEQHERVFPRAAADFGARATLSARATRVGPAVPRTPPPARCHERRSADGSRYLSSGTQTRELSVGRGGRLRLGRGRVENRDGNRPRTGPSRISGLRFVASRRIRSQFESPTDRVRRLGRAHRQQPKQGQQARAHVRESSGRRWDEGCDRRSRYHRKPRIAAPASDWHTVADMMQHELIDMTEPSGLDARWKALAARDAAADGTFVYARHLDRRLLPAELPQPPAARGPCAASSIPAPRRGSEGFRPCKRCRPDTVDVGVPGMEAVRRVSAYLAAHADQPVTLARLGARGLDEPAPPAAPLQGAWSACRRESSRRRAAPERLRASLRRGSDVTTAIYEAGYGSPSRVYEGGAAERDGAVGVSPGRRRHADRAIRWWPARSAGCWSATTANGVCAVKLGDSDERARRGSARASIRCGDPRGRAGREPNG